MAATETPEEARIQKIVISIIQAHSKGRTEEIKSIWNNLTERERKIIKRIAEPTNVGRISPLKKAIESAKPKTPSQRMRRL